MKSKRSEPNHNKTEPNYGVALAASAVQAISLAVWIVALLVVAYLGFTKSDPELRITAIIVLVSAWLILLLAYFFRCYLKSRGAYQHQGVYTQFVLGGHNERLEMTLADLQWLAKDLGCPIDQITESSDGLVRWLEDRLSQLKDFSQADTTDSNQG